MPAKKTTRRPAAKRPVSRRPAAKKRPAARRPVKAAPRRVVYSRKPVATRRQVKAAPRKYARQLAAARVMTPAAVVAAVQAKVITPAVGAAILSAPKSPVYGPAMRSPSYKTPSQFQQYPLFGPAMAPGFSPKALPSVVAYSRFGKNAAYGVPSAFVAQAKAKTPLTFAQRIAQAASKGFSSANMLSKKVETPRSLAARQLKEAMSAKTLKAAQKVALMRQIGIYNTNATPKSQVSRKQMHKGESFANFIARARAGKLSPLAAAIITDGAQNTNIPVSTLKETAAIIEQLPAGQQAAAAQGMLNLPPPLTNTQKFMALPSKSNQYRPMSAASILTKKDDAVIDVMVPQKIQNKIEQSPGDKADHDAMELIMTGVPDNLKDKAAAELLALKQSEINGGEQRGMLRKILDVVKNNPKKFAGAAVLIVGLATAAGVHQYLPNSNIAAYIDAGVDMAKTGYANASVPEWLSNAGGTVAGWGQAASEKLPDWGVGSTIAKAWAWAFGSAAQTGGRRRRRGRRVLRGGRRPANARRNWY